MPTTTRREKLNIVNDLIDKVARERVDMNPTLATLTAVMEGQ